MKKHEGQFYAVIELGPSLRAVADSAFWRAYDSYMEGAGGAFFWDKYTDTYTTFI